MTLIHLLLAAALVPTEQASSECEGALSKVIGSADANTRVMITFTGSQSALLPAYERVDPRLEPTLFPISLKTFVLTLQLRQPNESSTNPVTRTALAIRICSLGLTAGGRFNGVMAFRRESTVTGGETFIGEQMIDAFMTKPAKE